MQRMMVFMVRIYLHIEYIADDDAPWRMKQRIDEKINWYAIIPQGESLRAEDRFESAGILMITQPLAWLIPILDRPIVHLVYKAV